MTSNRTPMKIIKIFTLVLSLHLLAICFIFILPGCATTGKESAEAASGETSALGNESGEMAAPTAGSELHPDFNAGLTNVSEPSAHAPAGRYAPTRPSWDFQSDTTEDVPEEILKPVPKTPKPAYLSKRDEKKDIQMHTVRSGDTLSQIARNYGTTVAELKRANALENDLIRIGDTLIIPGGSAPERKGPGPKPAAAPAKKKSAARGKAVHIVVSGDTPSAIARQYGMSARDLMELNHITDPTKLQIGQRLLVKTGQAPATTPRSASAVRHEEVEGGSTPSPADAMDERERSLFDEKEDIPVIPLDNDEGGGQGSSN